MRWLIGIGSFVFSGVLCTLTWHALTTGVVVGKYGAAASSHSLIYWLVGVDSLRKARAEQRADDAPR